MMLPGRRSSIDIVADILSLLRLGETGKTEIMLIVGMSFYQLQNYINRLLKLNLIVRAGEDGLIAYQATEKGLRLLTAIENVREMLKPVERIDLLPEYKVKAASSTVAEIGTTLNEKPLIKTPVASFENPQS